MRPHGCATALDVPSSGSVSINGGPEAPHVDARSARARSAERRGREQSSGTRRSRSRRRLELNSSAGTREVGSGSSVRPNIARSSSTSRGRAHRAGSGRALGGKQRPQRHVGADRAETRADASALARRRDRRHGSRERPAIARRRSEARVQRIRSGIFLRRGSAALSSRTAHERSPGSPPGSIAVR
jgi:hypothetical protein